MGLPRTALCHEWATTYGGSEQVAARLSSILEPELVYVGIVEPALATVLFGPRRVQPVLKHQRRMLPALALGWGRLNLDAYDLVVTSSHSVVNAIRPRSDALLVSYCHTPMRYAWEWRSEIKRVPRVLRPGWPAAAAVLRRMDRRWAQRVDVFIANSHNVAQRISSYYGRPSVVVYPPIDVDFWSPGPAGDRKDHFLLAGRLVPYKDPERVVVAATKAGVPLVVAGEGQMGQQLRLAAGPTVSFVTNPSRDELRELYRGAKALVHAGIEDFGMTLVEAQACGTPVIAFGDGGAVESVVDGQTGVLFRDREVDTLVSILKGFDPSGFDPAVVRRNAERFALERFDGSIAKVIQVALARDETALQSLYERVDQSPPG